MLLRVIIRTKRVIIRAKRVIIRTKRVIIRAKRVIIRAKRVIIRTKRKLGVDKFAVVHKRLVFTQWALNVINLKLLLRRKQ